MTTSRVQQQATVAARLAASEYSVWKRWLPLWHGIFYVTLVLATVVLLKQDSYSWWQYSAIGGLSLFLGIWYSLCVIVDPFYWRQHWLVTIGYLCIGWICWFGLILFFPIYLFLLAGLFPQTFNFPRMPWKIIGALLLMIICLWRQALAVGSMSLAFLFTLGISTFGIILGLYINSIARQSQERQHLIYELEATRQELAGAEWQAGVMEERQRLAHEIHDTLAQGFTSIIMHLESIDGIRGVDIGEVQTHLDYMRRTARANLAEARRLMWALQPEAFDHASLSEVLTTLAEHWTEENGSSLSVTITGHARSLRPEIEVTLLRAAQEAMTNVQKYANASQIMVTLSYMDDVVALDVEDDGRGFDSACMLASHSRQTSGGFGLKALRERVEQLGGTLAIESVFGEGTTLAVTLPAVNNDEAFSVH